MYSKVILDERPSDGIPTTNHPKTMSGLDGLGWPANDDKLKAGGDCPSAPCSPSSTPETDAYTSRYDQPPETVMVPSRFAKKLERERNYWRKEHDRVVCVYQHRLMELATSAITASHYPENVKGHASPEHAPKIDQTASSASHEPACSPSSD